MHNASAMEVLCDLLRTLQSRIKLNSVKTSVKKKLSGSITDIYR